MSVRAAGHAPREPLRPLAPPAEAAARAQLADVYSHVRSALAAGGFDINTPICNVAATVMAHAIERRGIGHARVVEGLNHLFVEVAVGDEVLWVDPTAAQFFTDGTPMDRFALSHGLIGTPAEVRGMVGATLDAWKLPPTWPTIDGALVARASGTFDPRLSVEDARAAIAPMLETALLHYTPGAPSYLSAASAAQDAWYRSGRTGPLITSFGSDIGPSLRRAYDFLEATP